VILFVPQDVSDRARELIGAAEGGALALMPGEDLSLETRNDPAIETRAD
jgi:hypothetical protein